MADKVPQTFENHARFVPAFHGGVFAILGLNLLFQLARLGLTLVKGGGHLPHLVMETLLSLALLGLFFYARQFPITVQDRVIRLEMRLRLKEVLPADMQPRIPELTPKQLVALRFAGDAELPELVRDVLAGKYASGTEIKKAIRDWQPDHLRA